MKIVLNRELLIKKLQVSVSAIPNNPIVPVTYEALMQVKDDHISVVTTDLEMTIVNHLPFISISEAKMDFICDIQTILKTITLLKSEDVVFDVTSSQITLSLSKSRKKYQIPITYSVDSFPNQTVSVFNDPIKLNGNIFFEAMKKASLFVNPNDLRVGFKGVCITSSDGSIKIMGGNSSVFASVIIPSEESIEKVVFPKALIKVAPNYTKSPELYISVDKDKRSIKIDDGSFVVIARLIDADFPDVESLLKSENKDVSMSVSKDDLLMAIKRVSIYGSSTSILKLDMTDDKDIIIEGENVDYNKRAEEVITTTKKDKEMNFVSGFNHSFFSQILTNFTSDEVLFSQVGPIKLGFIRDGLNSDMSVTWLLAPMVLSETKK